MTTKFLTASGAVSRTARLDRLLWTYAPLVIAIAFRLLSPSTANLSYLLLAAYALVGPSHAVRALLLSWLFTMINPALAPEASAAAIGRYAVLFAATIAAIAYSRILPPALRIRRFTLATLALGIFLVAHSIMFSPFVDVSVLKATSWMVAMATLISIWAGFSKDEHQQMEREVFGGLVLIALISLPLIASPLGYVRNQVGFQGILNHPQAFGPTMALLGAWAGARIFANRKLAWQPICLAGLCAILILLSEARTAGLAMMGGLVLAIVLGPLFANRSINQMAPVLRSPLFWVSAFIAVLIALFMAPFIASTVQSFITKSGRADVDGLFEAFFVSRGVLFEPMFDNIRQHPLTGIGFGIASDPEAMIVQRDSIIGLPISAPVEKGTVPIMMVEEIGIFGAVAVGLWIFALLRGSAKGGLVSCCVCMTVLLLNLGEATMFSPGGQGLLLLILLGWACSAGKAKHV